MFQISSNRVNLDNVKGKYNNALRTIPIRFGAAAVEHTKENFREGGFVDESLQKWPTRENDKDPGRGLLIGKGTAHLSRDVRMLETTDTMVKVGTTLPYAKVHNEGFKGEVRQQVGTHTRKGRTVNAFSRLIHQNIPQRKFLGRSVTLYKKLQTILIEELKKINTK